VSGLHGDELNEEFFVNYLSSCGGVTLCIFSFTFGESKLVVFLDLSLRLGLVVFD